MKNNINNINWTEGVAWSKEFETGNTNIDVQHKQLFKLTSDLIESCQRNENDKKKTVAETLAFLTDYTVMHFADEEKLAREYMYPEYKEHEKMHGDFTQVVVTLNKQFKKNGDTDSLFLTVNKLVVRWLLGHIKREDSKIAKHIKLSLSLNDA